MKLKQLMETKGKGILIPIDMTEEEQLKAIRVSYKNISGIKSPTEKPQLAAIKKALKLFR